tara:strand:- start:868 stop:1824 length:957 start_codon:yes stop_codon:yes gene_type:complete
MIIIGGITRLTDSGLSITKWQLFSGILPPLNTQEWIKYFDLYKTIPEYKLQNFSMTLEEFKVIFWWEWIHRLLGRLIGLFFLLPLIYFYLKLGFSVTKNFIFIFILICFQGFIGWYMVTSGLIDRVDVSHFRLSVHLILAFIILSLIYWNILKFKNINNDEGQINNFHLIFFIFLIFLQIIFGAFVAGMDGGKIYNSWPLMGVSYFPNDNSFLDLFKLSAFSDPSLVQFMHRNLAYFIVFYYLIIFLKIKKNKILLFYKTLYILGVLLFLQVLLGILTLLFDAKIIIASMHQICSIFLVSSCIYLFYLNLNFKNQTKG